MNHLWYLAEDLVVLAFFSDDVPDERKLAMLSALKSQPEDRQCKNWKQEHKCSGETGNMKPDGFVTERSQELFESPTIDSAFMTDHPRQTWSGLAEYSTRMLGRLCLVCELLSMKQSRSRTCMVLNWSRTTHRY